MTKGNGDQSDIAPLLTLAVTAAAMTWWTWGTWTDLFVDSGRELSLAWQIFEGRALYRDVASFNGPLSPSVNALWFHVFGLELRALVIGNLALLLLFIGLLYTTLRHVASRLAATVAAMVFVLVFAFGEYGDVANFNYVTPYSHELVHGLFLSVLAMHALAWHARGGGAPAMLLSGLALGATLLTKPEVAVAAALACGFGVVSLWWRGTPHRRGRDLAGFIAGMSVSLASAWLLLAQSRPGAEAALAIAAPFVNLTRPEVTGMVFYQRMSGLDRPAAALTAVGLSLLAYAGVAALAGAAGIAGRRRQQQAEATALAGAILFVAILGFSQSVMSGLARAFPVLMLAGAGLLLRRMTAGRSAVDEQARDRLRFMLVLFAGLLLGKMALNARLSQYGFGLAMPAALLVVLALLDWLPGVWQTRGADGRVIRNVVLCAIGSVVLLHLVVHKQRMDRQTMIVGAGGDRVRADERAVPMNAMLDLVRTRLGPQDRLAVLPEGALVNFLSRHRSSSPYSAFLPPEAVIFGETALQDSIQRDPPEYAIVVERPEEPGMSGFGTDYLVGLSQWLHQHYVTVATVPGTRDHTPSFGMVLLRRRDLP